jgi:excisionase family DNA binding protein
VSIVNYLRSRNSALTSAELCELINVHPVTLREWSRAGRVPAYRTGREYRYDPDKVADWLDHHEVA